MYRFSLYLPRRVQNLMITQPRKAIDGQEVTSWQEDVAGYGHGENLTLKFEKTYTVKYLALKLGSWKDDAAYEQNNRPKRTGYSDRPFNSESYIFR